MANLNKTEVEQACNVGNDSKQHEPLKKDSTGTPSNKRKMNSRFAVWIFGGVVSFLPIFSLALCRLINSQGDFCKILQALVGIFSSVEVIYVVVTMAITAVIDHIGKANQGLEKSDLFNLSLVMMGALIYGICVFAEERGETVEPLLVFIINAVVLFVVFWANRHTYEEITNR